MVGAFVVVVWRLGLPALDTWLGDLLGEGAADRLHAADDFDDDDVDDADEEHDDVEEEEYEEEEEEFVDEALAGASGVADERGCVDAVVWACHSLERCNRAASLGLFCDQHQTEHAVPGAPRGLNQSYECPHRGGGGSPGSASEIESQHHDDVVWCGYA